MSQAEHLLKILSDGKQHDRDDLIREIYGFGAQSSRLAARCNDLRKKGHEIIGHAYEGNRKRYWYQLVKKEVPAVVLENKEISIQQGQMFSLRPTEN